MGGVPNEEKPNPLVPDTFVPPRGIRRPVKRGETWSTIANGLGIDPWDLIDFNFPGTKRIKGTNPQRAMRQVNWYLREYVGCQTSTDGENWAFDFGLTKGEGVWRGSVVFTPPSPPPPPPPQALRPRCTPTSAGLFGRRHSMCRLLSPTEQALVVRIFTRSTLPALDTIAICDGLGKDGSPWTDMTPETVPGLRGHSSFQLNLGDAAHQDLTLKHPVNLYDPHVMTSCFVSGIAGTLSDLLVHEMTHVWQYHNVRTRIGLWISHFFGDYDFTAGGSWDSYDVEQQASIVEKWYHDGEKKTDQLYPYIRLVVRSHLSADGLRYASSLTLNELNRDLADLRARKLD